MSDPIVVDLMAGTGEIWPIFLEQHPDTKKIIAIDISHQMHLHALEQMHRDRSHRIEHIEADFLENQLPEGLADCVISSFGLKTLNRDQQSVFAKELARILKPGGVFTLVEASDPKGWIFRPVYRFYLDRVLPMVERLILRGTQDFAFLGAYTRAFDNCLHLKICLEREGLETRSRRYFFGCATGLSGRKAPINELVTPTEPHPARHQA
jgi:ubiquinone/menaquinone biosynthesis C-methylase UbiE